MRFSLKLLPILLPALLLASCGDDSPPSSGTSASLGAVAIDYPLEGSVFPPAFTPPTFLWHDDTPEVSRFRITLSFADGGLPYSLVVPGAPPPKGEVDPTALGPTNEVYEGTPYQNSARSWTPDPENWAAIQKRSTESEAVLRIEGLDSGREALSRGEMRFTTSADPVDAPIFYRDVPLMPAQGKDGTIRPLDPTATRLIGWRLRDVSRPDSKLVLTGMPSCANCHSFSADGKTLGMDVDGPQGDKGAYAVAPLAETTVIGDEQVITWNSFPDKPEGHRTIGFLSRISPDGSHVLSTVNEALYVNNFTNYRFLQVFYPTRGIIACWSKESGEMKALPGAADPAYVQCSPVWSPDGEWIVFARAKARDPYPPEQPRPTFAGDPNELPMQYDLYRMPFNDGKGGTPVPIEGASGNGMSNTFPKITPDGKWLVWTKCKNGLLMRPDGRLWIVPVEGGEPREMNCNTALMNSWHSFSPNGRWMVFSSKVNTPYTQMFLTHLDEDGHDTPPILIPHSTAANRAVNIPEFVARDFDAFDAIDVPAVKHHRLFQDGMGLVREGRLEEGKVLIEEAIAEEPDFSRAMVALGFVLIEMERGDEARTRLRQALEIDPWSSDAHVNLGLSWLREGKPGKSVPEFERALEIESGNYQAHHNLGLAMAGLGKPERAHEELELAARLKPDDPGVRNDYGFLLQQEGKWDAAIREYRAALERDPNHLHARANLAWALREKGRPEAAVEEFRRVLEVAPGDRAAARALSELLLDLGRGGEAIPYLTSLLESTPDDQDLRLQLAWLLSTLPDAGVRDGKRAVELAEAVRAVLGESAGVLDVLAAAYAEAGRFEEAVETGQRALRLAEQGRGTAAPGLAERVKGYAQGLPFRQ